MGLDLGKTALQLDQGADALHRSWDDRYARLHRFIARAFEVKAETARELTAAGTGRPYLSAQVSEALIGGIAPREAPTDWRAVSVDGSHIDVDRHLPAPCFLVNLGGCILDYGASPGAVFFNEPQLAIDRDDLHLADEPGSITEQAVTGQLLGVLRGIRELERLADEVENGRWDHPVLALVDGTLVLWGLAGRIYPPFVRETLLHQRFLPALERFRRAARERPVVLAAYVSLPRTTEVANAIRCCLCPFEASRCSISCNNRRSTLPPCDTSNDFLDREVFREILGPGCRSPVYGTDPEAARDYPREHQISFFYLNTGAEIARVEVPRWVAADESLLALGHALIVQQCDKGQGYPVAISEAHEQAVITGLDRQLFRRMVLETLEGRGLPTYTSEKERSKGRPWL